MGNFSNNKLTTLEEFLFNYKTLRQLRNSPLGTRINFVQNGISKDHLKAVKALLHFDYDTLSSILQFTNRAIHLKRGNDLFNPVISDRIMMLLELYSFGYEVMGGHADFHEWMKQPNEKFLQKTPIETIITHSGLLAVRNELTNIQFGHL